MPPSLPLPLPPLPLPALPLPLLPRLSPPLPPSFHLSLSLSLISCLHTIHVCFNIIEAHTSHYDDVRWNLMLYHSVT